MKNTRTPNEAEVLTAIKKLSPERLRIVRAAVEILAESSETPSQDMLLEMATARAAEKN